MKTMLTLLCITGMLSAKSQTQNTTTVNNNQPIAPEASFTVSLIPGNTSFNLVINNPEKKKLEVRVLHKSFGIAADTVIYSDYRQRYNLNQADDGQYTIEVKGGRERVIREIELNTVTTRNVVIH